MAVRPELSLQYVQALPQLKSPLEHEKERLSLQAIGSGARKADLEVQKLERDEQQALAVQEAFKAGEPKLVREKLVQAGMGQAVLELDTTLANMSAAQLLAETRRLDAEIKRAQLANAPHTQALEWAKDEAEAKLKEAQTAGELADTSAKQAAAAQAATRFQADQATGFATGDLGEFRRLSPQGTTADYFEFLKQKKQAENVPLPGRDVPLPPAVAQQRAQISAAGRVDPALQISTVNDQGQAVTRVVPRSQAMGQDFVASPTADMRNKQVARGLVGRSIAAIEALSKKLITKVGIAQRATAAGRSIDAALGNDPEYRTYQDARMALAGNLAVGQQGARPSDADIKAIWLPLVPDMFRDTSESAKMKWDLIKTMSAIEQPATESGGWQIINVQ